MQFYEGPRPSTCRLHRAHRCFVLCQGSSVLGSCRGRLSVPNWKNAFSLPILCVTIGRGGLQKGPPPCRSSGKGGDPSGGLPGHFHTKKWRQKYRFGAQDGHGKKRHNFGHPPPIFFWAHKALFYKMPLPPPPVGRGRGGAQRTKKKLEQTSRRRGRRIWFDMCFDMWFNSWSNIWFNISFDIWFNSIMRDRRRLEESEQSEKPYHERIENATSENGNHKIRHANVICKHMIHQNTINQTYAWLQVCFNI